MREKMKFYISKALRKYLNPPAVRDCTIDATAAIWDNCILSGSKIGRYTYISDHARILHAEVGAFCSIGTLCQIGGASHPMHFASTSPVFYQGHNAFGKNFAQTSYSEYQQTVIGNDVWIGASCLIKSGVRIADGAVIGMGSVVTKDVGPYEVWAGNPARLLKKRFDEDTIQRLIELAWWTWPEDKLRENGWKFENPQHLLNMDG
ncbi:MAG: CatB-related O-acetyltransferase [bacterium]|nr:CatB-related O-acetyltransferase [bacterium]